VFRQPVRRDEKLRGHKYVLEGLLGLEQGRLAHFSAAVTATRPQRKITAATFPPKDLLADRGEFRLGASIQECLEPVRMSP
jgi:hypothetical protein